MSAVQHTSTGPGHGQVRVAGSARADVYAVLATALAALSLLIVALLWTGGGGLRELADGGTAALASAGRLTGLLSADLLLLQVLLLARIPLAERAFGQDRLARWHRWAGFTSFHLLLAHLVLITLGYTGAGGGGPVAVFVDLVVTYPGMLLALAGTLLLVLVVVTSLRAARRRLRYESWHLLHLYAYLGIALAVPHQLWTGAEFVSSPAATAYWWSLYLLATAAVLAYRVALPLWRSLYHRLAVSHVVAEAPGLVSVYLRGRGLRRLPVRAGQFFLWRFRDGPGWTRAHPYSLSGPPRGDLLRITVKDLGDGSARAASLRPGTRVYVEGPYGRLTGEHYRGGPVTMLACGVGITPLLALLWELPYRPGQATLLYRARDAADLAFRAELDWLAEHRGVRVVTLLGPRARPGSWLPYGHSGPPAEALRRLVPDLPLHDVYVCGPDEWTEAVRRAARAAGIPAEQLHTERFAW
ncbi:ferric reductase-like transmembrane domain-containing protein [Catellatospora sp. KI3]|uniref:ferredoxin reductase family protein n=1 Tax=Catellatospora sp. KI3 TaxID=3041620 RepID=UPI002482B7F5|nr:ferric reductase-like transmembrane domain-containing protein [Catellatospora sp. KI3]MDI1466045.1 ferric reductase-like transmembrane domain-containing protein [Catellatospora sp. KI3]